MQLIGKRGFRPKDCAWYARGRLRFPVSLFLALALCGSRPAAGEDPIAIAKSAVSKPLPESELAIEEGWPAAHFVGFSGEVDSQITVSEIEYDRHSWGSFLKARWDYVAAIIPLAAVRQPVVTDIYGDAESPAREWNLGGGFSPMGTRLLWRPNRAVKPFFLGKAGVLFFSRPAMAPKAGQMAFLFRGGGGMETRINQKMELRWEAEYLHVSNAFIYAENPGIDEFYVSGALCFQLGPRWPPFTHRR